jgi:hypothetical protein
VPVSTGRGSRYRVAAPATPQLVAALTGWLAENDVTLSDLQTGRPSLEDVFVRLTSGPSPVEEAAP